MLSLRLRPARLITRLACLPLASVIVLTACAPATGTDIETALGKEVTLSPGRTVRISGQDLSLTFKAVTADSRCPTGVTCVWEGEAKCQVSVTLKGVASETVFTVNGASDGYSQGTFSGYRGFFKLSPYPAVGKPIAAGDYRLLLKVEKAP